MSQYSCLTDRQLFSCTGGLLELEPEYKQVSSQVLPFSPVKCTACKPSHRKDCKKKKKKTTLPSLWALQFLPELWIIWECTFGISIVALRLFTLLVLIRSIRINVSPFHSLGQPLNYMFLISCKRVTMNYLRWCFKLTHFYSTLHVSMLLLHWSLHDLVLG